MYNVAIDISPMSIKDKICDSRNIYAAMYALPGFLKETGLVGCVRNEDVELLQSLRRSRYIVNESFLEECKSVLEDKFDKDDDLFTVRLFFKYKGEKDGKADYRPIHTADIKTLVCLQAIANVLMFDDDLDGGTRQLSPLAKLVPQNFYGNRLDTKPEYLYKKWSSKYEEYVKVSIEKHKLYKDNGKYTHEGYLDIKNFFPNINVNYLANYIDGRLDGLCDKDELRRALCLLFCFQIDSGDSLSESEKEIYYGKDGVKSKPSYFTKGLPQGLPHCAFFANLYMIRVKDILESVIPCDACYYVDDMTIFSCLDIAGLKDKVKEANKSLAGQLACGTRGLHKDYDNFTSQLAYEVQLHDDDAKCSSIALTADHKTLSNLSVLSRRTSCVQRDLFFPIKDSTTEATLSQVGCLTEAISKELATERGGAVEALYRKRLESFYKFYVNRRDSLAAKPKCASSDALIEDLSKLFDKGLLQAAYRRRLGDPRENGEEIAGKVKAFDKEKAGGKIADNRLYFAADSAHYRESLPHSAKVPAYACLYDELTSRIGNARQDVFEQLGKDYEIIDHRSFVYKSSNKFQRDYKLALACLILHIPLTTGNAYVTAHYKQLTWNELRVVHYLRQNGFNQQRFKQFLNSVRQDEKSGRYSGQADLSLAKVSPLFIQCVKGHLHNDHLLLAHHYVYSMWKNGSKFLHFFTLHNVEHSIELVEKSTEVERCMSIYQLSSYDHYLLFLACYLHDISLVDYPDVLAFPEKSIVPADKDAYADAYKKVDAYFENEIRTTHPNDSAELVRRGDGLSFLEDTTRDLVAAISRSHGMDSSDVYPKDLRHGEKKHDYLLRSVHLLYLKTILRLADSLDMSQERVSPLYLNKVEQYMPEVSRFHWMSHLAVKECCLQSKYELNNKDGHSWLAPENLRENVRVNITMNGNLALNAGTCYRDKCDSMSTKADSEGCTTRIGEKEHCGFRSGNHCPLVCKWMRTKNKYLNEELANISKMANAGDDRLFTTTIDVHYRYDKAKSSIDAYLPFIDRYIESLNDKH